MDARAERLEANAQQRPTVLVVERNQLFREGLARLLEGMGYDVRAGTGAFVNVLEDAVETAVGPLVALVGPDELDPDIAETIAAARAVAPKARIVLLSDADRPAAAVSAFHAGVDGCVLRDVSSDVIAGCIDLVALGERIFPSRLVDALLKDVDGKVMRSAAGSGRDGTVQPEVADLSKRELQILASLAQGRSNKQIAEEHELTEATIKVHLRNILRKIHADNRTQAAVWAITHNLAANKTAE